MKIHDKALAALQGSRRSRKQSWTLQRKEWAERALQVGFARVPIAAEVLEPIMAWKMAPKPSEPTRMTMTRYKTPATMGA